MLSATELRSNIYKVLDKVIETGVPVKINRNGKILRIVPDEPPDKLKNLKSHPDFFTCNADDFIQMDWSNEVDIDLS